jgi:hypothetical protein
MANRASPASDAARLLAADPATPALADLLRMKGAIEPAQDGNRLRGDREGQGRGKSIRRAWSGTRRPEGAAVLRSARSGPLHSRAGEEPQRLYGGDTRPAHRTPPASGHRAPRNSWRSQKRIRGRECVKRPSQQPGSHRGSARGQAPEGEGIRWGSPFVFRGFDLFKIH